jgi:hypothetical protein
MEALNAERKGYVRLAAQETISDAELDDLLSELDEKRQRIASELRAAEETLAMRRTPSYSLVHAEWAEDPDAIQPGEVLTLASSPDQIRAAYRRHGVRFEVNAEGTLTMRMELPLSGPSYRIDNFSPESSTRNGAGHHTVFGGHLALPYQRESRRSQKVQCQHHQRVQTHPKDCAPGPEDQAVDVDASE